MMRSTFRSLQAAALISSLCLGVTSLTQAQDAEEQEEEHWYDGLSVGAFVDAYGALRSDRNSGPRAPNPMSGQGSPVGYFHEAYVQADGFALAFAGTDISYSGDQFGATISLRFGPGVNRFYAADMGIFGIDNVTQAFATWKPFSKLTLDFGQFSTIYGAEVAESWRNLNYSRGGLYYAMQPFWHTGLRANLAITDMFALNALVVNGVNNAFENNKSPSLGLQALLTPNDAFFLAVGYLGALNPRAGGEGLFHNFFDVVATVTAGDFKLILNGDYNMYKAAGGADSENWWGASVAPGYSFTSWFGAAARVEYLSDSANLWGMTKTNGMLANKASLVTLTGTLDFKPVPNSSAVVLRPEFRYELAGDQYFYNGDNESDDKFWTAHLGVVVTSMK